MDWTRIINGDAYETDMFISNLIYDIASGEHDLNDMAKESYNKYTEKLDKLTKSLDKAKKELLEAESKSDNDWRKEFDEKTIEEIKNYETSITNMDGIKKKSQEMLNHFPSLDKDNDFYGAMEIIRKRLYDMSKMNSSYLEVNIKELNDKHNLDKSYQWWKYCKIQSLRNYVIDTESDIKMTEDKRCKEIMLMTKIAYELGLGPVEIK